MKLPLDKNKPDVPQPDIPDPALHPLGELSWAILVTFESARDNACRHRHLCAWAFGDKFTVIFTSLEGGHGRSQGHHDTVGRSDRLCKARGVGLLSPLRISGDEIEQRSARFMV